jgi:hypothetical protein
MMGVEGEEYRRPPRYCKNAINTQNTYPVEIIDKYPNV